ncbi:hypothetical protein ACIPRI_23875 [Variovorax sp. LARHSF232]
MGNQLAEAVGGVVEVLNPLTSEERIRVVNAALTLLGEVGGQSSGRGPGGGRPADDGGEGSELGLSPAVKAWLRKVKLEESQLEEYFHFDQGKAQPIALPGNASKRIAQVVSTYLMQGLSSYLASGEPAFADADARKLCEHFGCYDHTNHAKYLKEFGNKITGSKAGGWKLTAPGLSAVADLIKQKGGAA